MDDIIRDSNGNKITTGDKVKFLSRMDMITKEGVITKMIGGSFGIKDKDHIALYKYRDVDKYMISKIKK
jgi:hypothetical protein